MTVDKGGLNYGIVVQDGFSTNLNAFRTKVQQSRKEWALLRTELNKGLDANGTRSAISAITAISSAEAKLKKARREGKVELTAKEAAEKRYSRAVFNSAASREEARIAEQRGFNLDRKILTTQQAKRKAEQDIAKVANRRKVIEERLNIIRERSIKLTEREAISLGLASKATAKLTDEQRQLQRARDRLAAAQRRQSDERLIKLEVERAAIERIARARQAQLVTESLARQGFSPTGVPLQQPEDPARNRRTLDFFRELRQRIDRTNTSGNRISFTFRRLFGILAAFAVARIAVQFFRDMVVQTIRLNAELEIAQLGIASLIASVGDVRDIQGEATDAAEALAIAQGEARRQVKLLRIDALRTTATFQELVGTFQNALAPGLRAGLDIDQVRQFSRQISIAATAIGLEQRQLAEEVRSLLSATIRPQNTRIATFLGITNEDVRKAQEAGQLFEFLSERLAVFDQAGSLAAETFTGLAQRVKDASQIIAQIGGFGFFRDLKSLLADTLDTLIQVDQITQEIKPNQELVDFVSLLTDGLGAFVAEARRIGQSLRFEDLQQVAAGFRDLSRFISQILGGAVQGLILGLRDASNILRGIQATILRLTGVDILDSDFIRNAVTQFVRLLTIVVVIGGVIASFSLAMKGFAVILGGVSSTLKGVSLTLKGIRLVVVGLRSGLAALGVASSPFLASMLAALAAAASILFVVSQITGLLDLKDTALGVYGARALQFADLAAKDVSLLARGPFLSTEQHNAELDAINDLADQYDQSFKDNKETQISFEEAFKQSWDRISSFTTDIISGITDDVKDLGVDVVSEFDQSIDGIILSTSQALQDLRGELEELDNSVRDARLESDVTESALGLEQSIAQVVQDRGRANVEFLQKSLDLTKEIEKSEANLANLRSRLALDELTEEQANRINGTINAVEAQIRELTFQRERLENVLQLAASSRTQGALQQAIFDQEQESTLQRIEAVRARLTAQAERERDFRRVALIDTQAQVQVLNAEEREREQTINRSLAAIRQEIELTKQRIALIRQEDQGDGIPENLERIRQQQEIADLLQFRSLQLQSELATIKEINAAERQRLGVQEQINQAAVQNPIGAGFLQSFVDSFNAVADKFQVTLDIMSSAVQGFSQFVAQSLVSAFDPNATGTVQERFAQFLQQIATQIIATLVQLAISAAVLNAASGGLLGPFLRSLAVAQGFAEGGEVGKPKKRRRVRGYAEGGSPSESAVHGVARPARGLDPRDTVAAWLDPREWVIKATSVARAGRDAMDRINRGLFDPYKLREAVGLSGWRRHGVRLGKTGMGLVEGGEVSQVSRAASQVSPAGSGGSSITPAIMTASADVTERIIRAGKEALLRELASEGILPQ